ncbi:MAG: hypothetical protein HC893_05070 [Chloroflexaceae bacterium]|nr:hypothetical protein [Chloroflexaceae bacterium]
MRGQPTNEAARILSQDQIAAFLGSAFREVTFIGAGAKIPQAGQVFAAWNWGSSSGKLLQNPSKETWVEFGVTSVVLLLVTRGNAQITLPRGNQWSSLGGLSGLQATGVLQQAMVIGIPTRTMAGACAGAMTGGSELTILLAQSGSGGAGAGSTSR